MANLLDKLQAAAEGAGVVDPTGIVDAANAIVYAARGAMDPARRKEHFASAAISAASILPFGDVAKLSRVSGKAGAKAGRRGMGEAAETAGFGQRRGISKSDVLSAGTNFGDIMGGKTSMQQAQESLEAIEAEKQAKQKLADTVKNLTGLFGSLAFGVVGLTKLMGNLAKGSVARQAAELGEVSAGIAGPAARLEAERIQRRRELGGATEETFTELTAALNEFEQAAMPFTKALTNLSNMGITIGTQMATAFANHLRRQFPLLALAMEALGGDEAEPTISPYREMLGDLAAGRMPEREDRDRL